MPDHITPQAGRESDRGLHYPDLKARASAESRNCDIPRFGRVNLITGIEQHMAQSTVLEALRLHAHNAAPQVVGDILA